MKWPAVYSSLPAVPDELLWRFVGYECIAWITRSFFSRRSQGQLTSNKGDWHDVWEIFSLKILSSQQASWKKRKKLETDVDCTPLSALREQYGFPLLSINFNRFTVWSNGNGSRVPISHCAQPISRTSYAITYEVKYEVAGIMCVTAYMCLPRIASFNCFNCFEGNCLRGHALKNRTSFISLLKLELGLSKSIARLCASYLARALNELTLNESPNVSFPSILRFPA